MGLVSANNARIYVKKYSFITEREGHCFDIGLLLFWGYDGTMQEEVTWLEGRLSIQAAIQGGSREVKAVYIRAGKWDRGIQFLRRLAADAAIEVQSVDDEFIAANVSGKSHGGVIAKVGPRCFNDLHDLTAAVKTPFVVMLDGFEDPFNFGQAVRALYAAGADGIVVRPRNWLSAAGIVARASAGAAELIPIAVADSAQAAADFFRAFGLKIACTTQTNAISIYDADLAIPLFMLVGGERRGITRSFLDQADLRLQIPYNRDFSYSLGAAASAAVLGFEVMRQRHFVGR